MKKGLFALLTVALLAQASAFASEDMDAMDRNVDDSAVSAAILPPPFPPPVPTVSYTCYAQNRRGQMFPAVGYDQIATQALAVRYCQANSLLRCTAIGCNVNQF